MSPPPPTKYGVALFSGFQLLDVCGPLDMINLLSTLHNQATLYILAESLEPVPTNPGKPCNQLMVPTHTFSTCPQDIEVLLIPGGMGCRTDQIIASAVEFVKNIYPKLRYLMTVCTGTVIVARSGVLDGRRATSNKAAFRWVEQQGPNVKWVPEARWVVDGNIYTSSGVSAGMDLMCAFIAEMHGDEVADLVATRSEYTRQKDSSMDPFAKLYGLAA